MPLGYFTSSLRTSTTRIMNVTMTATGASLPAGIVTRVDNIRQDVDLVTVRVNYRWGSAVVARY